MTGFSGAMPTRNPVPRHARRRSIDQASAEEYQHLEHAAAERSFLSCWFCWHAAAEHLEHDWLVEGCPDCVVDARSLQ